MEGESNRPNGVTVVRQKVWSWVLWGPKPRITALAMASSKLHNWLDHLKSAQGSDVVVRYWLCGISPTDRAGVANI